MHVASYTDGSSCRGRCSRKEQDCVFRATNEAFIIKRIWSGMSQFKLIMYVTGITRVNVYCRLYSTIMHTILDLIIQCF